MNHRDAVHNLIQTLPAEARERLGATVGSENFRGVLAPDAALSLAKILGGSVEDLMMALLPIAKVYARPPISNYYVGAIAQSVDGTLYFGGNVEFEGQTLGSTIHAEQAAVMHAWIHGAEGIQTLAVNKEPCGHCRQFLNELNTAGELRILLPERDPLTMDQLLPSAFGPRSLDNPDGLMASANHGLPLQLAADDPLTQAALDATNRSYAPYSNNFAGVAVLLHSGEIFSAPYAENAAFNSSLSPLHAVLMQMYICGIGFDAIERAMLIERKSLCSQLPATEALLASVVGIALDVHKIDKSIAAE